MMDQIFGNDSLELFESIFIGSTGLAMAFIWILSMVQYNVNLNMVYIGASVS